MYIRYYGNSYVTPVLIMIMTKSKTWHTTFECSRDSSLVLHYITDYYFYFSEAQVHKVNLKIRKSTIEESASLYSSEILFCLVRDKEGSLPSLLLADTD